MSVSSGNRVKRLRDLVEQLERLPPTAERDRMLREVRARVVDVDTGADTQALLPVDRDSPAMRLPGAVAATPAFEDRRPRRTTALPQPARPVRVPARETVPGAGANVVAERSSPAAADLLALAADELLSLDDLPSFDADEAREARTPAPWTRGLRG